MAETNSVSRREFLSSSAVAGSVLALGTLDISRSAYAAGSDELKLALVGCGGRGTGAAANALGNSTHSGVRLIAMADAFAGQIDNSLKALGAQYPGKVDVPGSRRFTGLDAYTEAVASNADIVALCTPPGFRPRQFEAAVQAGKHVFMEKPVAVDAPGYRRVKTASREAARKGLHIAVGHHLRHDRNHREVISRIHDGLIGELMYTRSFFNVGPIWVRPRQNWMNEMQYQVHNWYHFIWLSGDHIVEQHVHGIDICNWIARAHPVEAIGNGGRQVRAEPGIGEIFDHHCVQYTYPDGTHSFSECRQQAGCWSSFSHHAYGTQGSVSFDGGNGAVMIRRKGAEVERVRPGSSGHQMEWEDLLASILKAERYNEADWGADSTMTAILGRMATYSGNLVKWDDAVKSDLTYGPEKLDWEAEPRSKPGPDGIYPCAIPGVTKAV